MNTATEGYDRERVKIFIETYDKLHPSGPDSIPAAMLSAREEQRQVMLQGNVNQRTGVINKNEAGRRLSMVMPTNLYITLQQKFPTIFKADRKKFQRHFPVFFEGWKP